MRVIHAKNVNEALAEGLRRLHTDGSLELSRNGYVLAMDTPVTTVYKKSQERVLFCPIRDANPFFHLMEAMWMLAGRQDLEFPRLFNSRFGEYSDDGITVPGAYGFRWRNYFQYDQLEAILYELRRDPGSRRAVLAMWDGTDDLLRAHAGSKDIPCNTHIYFRVNKSALDMTVCCRSNDILWGAYGANAVHMSFLQEYMAARLGVDIGEYNQVSNNFHIYTSVVPVDEMLARAKSANENDLYRTGITPMPLCGEHDDPEQLDRDIIEFMEYPLHTSNNRFINEVARPMYRAYNERKGKTGSGLSAASEITADDWRLTCMAWIIRREMKEIK